ncbi:hypothetical protein [Campylobacter estrildidarum]|uniref:EexN family lipoprotein n=1 Tax=Campylobacter estrildidarum TaxID=2510189 RepID=A0A4U7BBW2_9BACT|nr:hypothetical protein [Campylobacter estrildidarum]TKX28868.1 hypothetical protein CQA69_07985 [Campylobacter estrildidarum]
MKKIILGSVALFFLIGCGGSNVEDVVKNSKSIEYYSKNIEEAKAKVKECAAKQDALDKEQQEIISGKIPSIEFMECSNAKQVVANLSSDTDSDN